MKNAPSLSKEERFNLVLECRRSGLTDREWCIENGINPGTFYNWVKRFRREGKVDIPESEYHINHKPVPNYQDVVRVDILPDFTKSADEDHSGQFAATKSILISIGSCKIELDNSADPLLISAILRSLGGSL